MRKVIFHFLLTFSFSAFNLNKEDKTMKKNILLTVVLLFAFPILSLAQGGDESETVSIEKEYLCEKGDEQTVLNLTIVEETSCRLDVEGPDTEAHLSSNKVKRCKMSLAKKVIHYIDQGYSCFLSGGGISRSTEG